MKTPEELKLESVSKEEEKDEQEKKEKEIEQEKENENENTALSKFEVIELFQNTKNYNKNKIKIFIIVLIFLFIFLFLMLFLYFFNEKLNQEEITQLFNLQNQTGENVKLLQENSTNNTELMDTNILLNITDEINLTNNTNYTKTENTHIIEIKKTVVGFVFPKINNFMITNGEFFLKTGKYDILFITKSPKKKELKFSKKIKRLDSYFDKKAIQKICKNDNIEFLIVNTELLKDDVKWLKSLGIKLIGFSQQIYENEKKITGLKSLKYFDAYVNQNIEDFKNSKRLGLKNNILIPNMINLESRNLSNLSNHNVMMIGELDEKKNNISSIISSLALIIKEVNDTIIDIFSLDKPSNELIELIKNLNLTGNINFNILNEKITDNIKDYSLFIYTSITENYQNILFEAKSYGIPCITFFEFPNNIFFHKGVIKFDLSNNQELISETVRLLKDNKYKRIVGKETKSSLDMINEDIEIVWHNLFNTLKKDEKEFQKLRDEIEEKLKQI